nr:putative ribonuclease H-like domain-containing protein [Tanacetum cinerariifolium]
HRQKKPTAAAGATKIRRPEKQATTDDKSHIKCEECGMNRHTKDQCFKIIGYPDWWTDGHKTTSNKGAEKDKPSTSPTANTRSTYMAQTHFKNPNEPWIFDCGATDTMSYELSDFTDISKPIKTHIQVANRERMNVKTCGTIKISPSIKLPNCLHVPSLSHKLLSISHVTKELNCSVLMHPTFCLLYDIRTGRIIGRGTERDGLYYVDEAVQSSTVMLAHGTTKREAW